MNEWWVARHDVRVFGLVPRPEHDSETPSCQLVEVLRIETRVISTARKFVKPSLID